MLTTARSVRSPIVLRLVILSLLLPGIDFAGTPAAQVCYLTNGLAEGFFGAINVAGWFTQGLAPNDISSIWASRPNNAVDPVDYAFTGQLNGPGYAVPSQLPPTPCILLPCSGAIPMAGLFVSPQSPTVADLFFVDSGEDFTGVGTLACSTFPGPPPGSGPPNACPVNVIHYPGPPDSEPATIDSSVGWPTTMNANYSPLVNGAPVTLAQAAELCQVDSFNFIQQIDFDTDPLPNYAGVATPTPNSDPVLGGYCKYNDAGVCVPGAPYESAYPFYWNLDDLDGYLDCGPKGSPTQTANTLFFADCPADSSVTTAEPTVFTTSLVGVIGTCSSTATQTTDCTATAPLYTWSWTSSFNGKNTGGVNQLKSYAPVNPTSGTGGVTIISINGVQFPPVVPPGQISTIASGLAYSRVSKTFTGTVTITNISGAPISGPLQIVFFGLPATVTLVNATNNLSGTPYVTVPAPAGITPGQSMTVAVQFSNPSNAIISLTPVIYAGSFQ
jgi:hypothetical protein